MSQDLLIKSDARGLYDLQISGADFEAADGFETAIPTSFFSSARAPATQVQEAKNRRGWVGNILYAVDDRELGGLLWTLDQTRLTNDTLNIAKSYAEASLQWMLDDGIARSIRITVEKTSARSIQILTDIVTIENTVQRYITLWRSTDISRVLA